MNAVFPALAQQAVPLAPDMIRGLARRFRSERQDAAGHLDTLPEGSRP